MSIQNYCISCTLPVLSRTVSVSVQPSQLLRNSRHLVDPRHPSTGIRPANLGWAKACWEREALTASVAHKSPYKHLHLLCVYVANLLGCSLQNQIMSFYGKGKSQNYEISFLCINLKYVFKSYWSSHDSVNTLMTHKPL